MVGYHKSNADGCIFVKSTKEANDCMSFMMCVTDIIPVLKNPVLLKAEKAALCERYEMTDEGYFPGMPIEQERERAEHGH